MFYLGSATDLGITVSLAIALCGQGKTEVEVSLKHGWCITVAAGTSQFSQFGDTSDDVRNRFAIAVPRATISR